MHLTQYVILCKNMYYRCLQQLECSNLTQFAAPALWEMIITKPFTLYFTGTPALISGVFCSATVNYSNKSKNDIVLPSCLV